MRNALSIAICFLLLQTGAVTGQTPWSGWDTPAGSRIGRPGLTTPTLKSAPLPPGLANRQPGRFTSTVDVLVTIEKDGRVNPVEILRPSRKRDAIEKQAMANRSRRRSGFQDLLSLPKDFDAPMRRASLRPSD